MSAITYYAIGDVHGMAGHLAALHDMIIAEIAASGAPSAVVHLGDYVDRGHNSRGVIQLVRHLGARLEGRAEVHALRGNHEQLMLQAIEDREGDAQTMWFSNGGGATISSYGGDPADPEWRDTISPDHILWLRALPSMLRDAERGLVFVHAGIEPATFPNCDEEILLWTRSNRFFDPSRWPKRTELEGVRVIHGHTPSRDHTVHADRRRINVDTGAVYGGPLTCVVLAPGAPERFLYGYANSGMT